MAKPAAQLVSGAYKLLAWGAPGELKLRTCCCDQGPVCDCDRPQIEAVASGVLICGYCSTYVSNVDFQDYSFAVRVNPNGTRTLTRCEGVCAWAWNENGGTPNPGVATFYDGESCDDAIPPEGIYSCAGYLRHVVWETAPGALLAALVLVITDKGGAPARMGVPDYLLMALAEIAYVPGDCGDTGQEANIYTSSGDCGIYVPVEPLNAWVGDGDCQFNGVLMVGGYGGGQEVLR